MESPSPKTLEMPTGCAHQSVPSTPSFFPSIILTHCCVVHVLDGHTSRRRCSRLEGGCGQSCGAVLLTLVRYVALPIAPTVLRPVGRFSFFSYYVSMTPSTCGVAERGVCKKRFVCMERMIFVGCRCRSSIIAKMPCACVYGTERPPRKGL